MQTILTINEIYKSVQGESTWAGLACVFVRLTGCPLRCVWCDSEFAFYEGEKLSVAQILERVRAFDCKLVELTGGEPLLQKHCPALARALLEAGYQVLVETSGALPIGVLPAEAIKIMDLKCPDSGECEQNDWSNLEQLSPRDEVKFVIASRADFDWAAEAVRHHALAEKVQAVLFSPAFGKLDERLLAEWLLESGLPVRLQLQLHKYIWAPQTRGV